MSGPTLFPDGTERIEQQSRVQEDIGENWKPSLVTEEDFSRSGQDGKAAGEEVEHALLTEVSIENFSFLL